MKSAETTPPTDAEPDGLSSRLFTLDTIGREGVAVELDLSDVNTLLTPVVEDKGVHSERIGHERLVNRIYREVEASGSEGVILWVIDRADDLRTPDEEPESAHTRTAQLIDLLAAMPDTIPAETRALAWEHLLSKDLSERDVSLAEANLELVHEEDPTMREQAKELLHRTFDFFIEAHKLVEEKESLKEDFMRKIVREAIAPPDTGGSNQHNNEASAA